MRPGLRTLHHRITCIGHPLQIVAFTLILLILVGCSSTRPTDHDLHDYVMGHWYEGVFALKSPLRYELAPHEANRLGHSIAECVQRFGLAFNPDGYAASLPEVKGMHERLRFWTDFAPLDEALRQMSLSRSNLNLTLSTNVFYEFQLVGSIAVERVGSLFGADLQTHLLISLRLRKRGLKSDFFVENRFYNPKPLLDWIAQDIARVLPTRKEDR